MMSSIFNELSKFIVTFGLLFLGFIFIGYSLKTEFLIKDTNLWSIILNIFDALTGNQKFKEYTSPEGLLFITLFVYVSNVMLISFLISMYINRYA